MANQEHLDILKQGVEVWNKWATKQYQIQIDLREADLSGTDLSQIILSDVDLTDADLRGVDLGGSTLVRTSFVRANLSGANLSSADLHQAILFQANLRKANLSGATFSYTDLDEADFSYARMEFTIFGDVDLRRVKGLKSVKHNLPSTIGINAIVRSKGDITGIFLQKAGVPDTFIEYARSLVRNPIEYYTCFISYSSKDQAFAERLHADLQDKGVRCWFAPEDLKTGEKFWHRIDESIRLYDKLLVILSKHSIASAWVENEVMTALEKEHKQPEKTVLFPIQLDKAVMETDLPWAANMRRTRHIGDFTKWKNHDDYQKAFNRLLRDLKASEKDLSPIDD